MQKPKLELVNKGKVPGQEHHISDVVVDGQNVGECYFDPKQQKFVARVDNGNLKKKIYRNTHHGIRRAIESLFEGAAA